MVTHTRVHLQTLALLVFVVRLSRPVCVEVPSETDAVLGKPMKLTCISCMKREEIEAKTHVDWFFTPDKDNDKDQDNLPEKIHIYKYDIDTPSDSDGPFKNRLTWNGSQDLQDISIQITNVTFNDSGTYECQIHREFKFDFFTPSITALKKIELKVKQQAANDPTALYSEIMMYVLLVFLTFWLLVEMVYCYRKISKSDEQAQDTATNYLAIPSEQKDNPAAPVTE
ncbi:sodium channel subunit beta-3 isoform X1 [Epinephelus moara]|uniref:sodium channel subunit beta-3 isoform X1 n=1 Tax=Epinephelus moara TaxID=300413 RepID=UPI00214E02CB|nr:sodium channel subunit beta-3 isoform X1 [Epinephelus moara]XP_049930424.1 sodium channel subunit beta-3 isoform X1 [Epinephelus moara]XP_049930426.1 sodium channel subunit beta-3 isoform X1 [Epinephelus moara]